MKNKISSIILTISLTGLMIITSCGKSGGSNGSSVTPHTDPVSQGCFTFKKSDSLIDIAVKAHRARLECNMTEEELLKVIKNS